MFLKLNMLPLIGPTLKLNVMEVGGGGGGGGGGGKQASFLVAKQAVEFPQVVTSDVSMSWKKNI